MENIWLLGLIENHIIKICLNMTVAIGRYMQITDVNVQLIAI